MGLAAVIMTAAVWFTLVSLPIVSPWLLIPIGGAVGVIIYFAISQLLKIREISRFTDPILARLGVGGGS